MIEISPLGHAMFPLRPLAAKFSTLTTAGAMNKGGTQQVGRVTVTHAVHGSGILDDGSILYRGAALAAGRQVKWQTR